MNQLPKEFGPAPTGPSGEPGGPNLIVPPARLEWLAMLIVLACIIGAFAAAFYQMIPLAGGFLVFAGAACGVLVMKNVIESQPLFLKIVLAIFGAAMLYLTVVVFEHPSGATVFPGITVAVAGGQLLGCYLRFAFTRLRAARQ
jgi:hypothetical protein